MIYDLIYIILFSSVVQLVLHYRVVVGLKYHSEIKKLNDDKSKNEIESFLRINGYENTIIAELEEGLNAMVYKYSNLSILFISKGLIDSFRINIVLSIIGHELGHFILGHTKIKSIIRVITLSIVLFISYTIMNENLYLIPIIPLLIYIKIIIDRYFDRLMEYQADKYSVKINGRDNMILLLKKLNKIYGNEQTTLLSSHPSLQSRINNISK